jgi:hypothetical protein
MVATNMRLPVEWLGTREAENAVFLSPEPLIVYSTLDRLRNVLLFLCIVGYQYEQSFLRRDPNEAIYPGVLGR